MKRGVYKTEAVVLNSSDYGESDRILALYTPDYGKLKGIAKGARRSRKRFVGNLDPAAHVRLIFSHSDKSELVRVEDASLIEAFAGLKTDIERLSSACYLLELVSEMTREGQAQGAVFGLLTGFLRMLEAGGNDEALLRFFEIRLLSLLGYLPCLDWCVVCKGPFGDFGGGLYFSSDKGGAVCRSCSGGVSGRIPLTIGTARLLSAAARFDADKLGRLKADEAFLREAEAVLEDFIRHQLGKELKTKKFLYKMRNAAV